MCLCSLLIRCVAVISIVAITFWQVHDLLVNVVKLGGKGCQIQEMATSQIFRKIFSAKLVFFLSDQDRC